MEHQEWNKWHVFSAEEKCLPRNDRDIESNWGLTKHLWYDKVNLTESNAPHILGEDATELGEEADLCAQLGAEHYLELLKSQHVSILPRRGDSAAPPELWLPQFDLVLLSVQEDGSVAGLFPGHPILEDETGAWVHPLWDAPTGPKGRVTLSLDVLSNAKQLWLVASSAEKEAVVGDAFAGLNPTVRRPTFETKAIPATLIGGSPRWLVDVFAIAKLPSNAPRADGCARRRLEHGGGSSASPSAVSDQAAWYSEWRHRLDCWFNQTPELWNQTPQLSALLPGCAGALAAAILERFEREIIESPTRNSPSRNGVSGGLILYESGGGSNACQTWINNLALPAFPPNLPMGFDLSLPALPSLAPWEPWGAKQWKPLGEEPEPKISREGGGRGGMARLGASAAVGAAVALVALVGVRWAVRGRGVEWQLRIERVRAYSQ